MSTLADTREALLHELRTGDPFLLVTHEHPDGDALGSLIGMQALLTALGKDSAMYIAPDEFPLPREYEFLSLDGLVRDPPQFDDDRIVVYLDCGNIDRNPITPPSAARILNIDHHHDNTRFGTLNHVVPGASCTAEIVWDLAAAFGVPLTVPMAEALYVGLVTDTGRFMYSNTGPRAHVMAADLIEAGVDAFDVYRRIYEGVPFGKLAILARGLAHVERYDEGRLAITWISEQDFAESEAEGSFTEGIVDHLRSLEGTLVAGLVRDKLGEEGARKVSLRASDERLDVSRIARAQGGGGHPQAAGFTTALGWEELIAFLRSAIAEQL